MPIQFRKIFAFDSSRSPERNIDSFFAHIAEEDTDLTQLLNSAIAGLLPLPEPGSDRNARRRQANAAVKAGLDQLEDKKN